MLPTTRLGVGDMTDTHNEDAATMDSDSITLEGDTDASEQVEFEEEEEEEEDYDNMDVDTYEELAMYFKRQAYYRNAAFFTNIFEGRLGEDEDDSENEDEDEEEDEGVKHDEKIYREYLSTFAQHYTTIGSDAKSIWNHYYLDLEPRLDTEQDFVCAVVSRAWEGSDEARWHLGGRPGPPCNIVKKALAEKRRSGESECCQTQAYENWRSHSTGRQPVWSMRARVATLRDR